MSARRKAFHQADVSRALKGALAAGLRPVSAEITAEGRIVMSFEETAPATPASAYDQWKARRDARKT